MPGLVPKLRKDRTQRRPRPEGRGRLFALGWLAPITFVGNLQTQAITLYAKGYKSTASGILGVDESWTITAN